MQILESSMLGLRTARMVFRSRHSAVAVMIAGGLSLWIFPTSPIHEPLFRQINLIVTPVALGLVMMLIGKIRLKKGQDLVRLDQFGYAFVFAFAMALVRFIWAA